MMLMAAPGFTTTLISFLQSLLFSRSRKKPAEIARFDNYSVRKATVGLLSGKTISPYWPGRIVPRLS
jgi:hypothetical protein